MIKPILITLILLSFTTPVYATDLFDRLYPVNTETTDKIGVHIFWGALVDYAKRKTTQNQIVIDFALDPDAESDLDKILTKIDSYTDKIDKALYLIDLHAVMLIAETGLKYSTKAAFKARMGL